MKRILLPLILAATGLVLTLLSFFISFSGAGNLDLEIQKASFIMPAAHNVYGNPNALNGKYYLFKTKLTNTSDKTLEGVTVRYRVPGYIDWTELEEIGAMFPGQSASVVCYPKFKDDITDKMTESVEKAEIEVTWDGASDKSIVEEEFSFKIVNRNDYVFTGIAPEEIAGWADVYDNDMLLACYVTPNDPIVKYYTQIVQEKILKGESASVSRDPKDAVRFLMGIYEATRLAHMVYSGTKGIPQSLDDVSSFSQHNRLPREVITGNTGLCLELSLLYASMLSAAGIDPIIFLIPGHAYPGFRMNNQYYAIEATGIGGEGLGGITSVEDAFNKGQKELAEFMQMAQAGDPRYTLVDVHALNQQGATPMALRDDEFLRRKVDQIAENFAPTIGNAPQQLADNNQRQPAPNTGGSNTGGGNAGGGNTGGGNNGGSSANTGGQRSSGPLSFTIPNGWQTASRPYPQIPIVSFEALSPDMTTNVVVYDVPASSIPEAMSVISEYLSYLGSDVQYNLNGNTLNGQTYSANGTYIWKGRGVQTQSGVRIVALGTFQQFYNQQSGIINSIFNSIR